MRKIIQANRSLQSLTVAAAVLALLAVMVAMNTAMSVRPAGAELDRTSQVTWHKLDADTAEFHSEVRRRASTVGPLVVGQILDQVEVDFGDGTKLNVNQEVISISVDADVVVTTAHFVHDFSGSGPFTVTVGFCCRIGGPAHVNNADAGAAVSSVVDLGAASGSPVPGVAPVVDCAVDAACSFPVPATDPDAAVLRYRLATPAEAGDTAFAQPPGAAIDAVTGLYTWNTAGVALNPVGGETLYSTQVIIERVSAEGAVVTSTAVDFLIRLPAPATPPPVNTAPVFDNPTPAGGSVILNSLPNQVRFTVAASDPDGTDTVTIAVGGVPAGGVVSSTPGNPAVATVIWTPTVEGSHVLTLTATDGAGASAAQRQLEIRVLPAPPNLPPRVNADVKSDVNVFAVINYPLLLDGEVVDPNPADVVTIQWDNNATPCRFSDPRGVDPYVTCTETGTFRMTLTASDGIAPPVHDDIDVIVVPNQPPLVTAGADISGVTNQPVAANGFVNDANAALDTVVIAWTASDPACTFARPSAAATTVMCSAPGSFQLTLTANDGVNPPVSKSVTFTVAQANRAPTVDAGPDSNGVTAEQISLDGTVTDPDGDPLSTGWTVDGLNPSGQLCRFGDPTLVDTTISCPLPGTFIVRLTARDGVALSVSDERTVVVSQANVAPVVSAGTDRTGNVDEPIDLGGVVTDADQGDVLSLIWSQDVEAGAEPACSFALPLEAETTVTCTQAGSFTLRLTASDGFNAPVSAQVSVVVLEVVVNEPPSVDAGVARSGFVGEPITLDGSATDADPAEALTLTWAEVPAPGASPVCSFLNVASADTTVICASAGTFTLRLSVQDGVNPPVNDTVQVTVTTRPVDPDPDPDGEVTVNAGADGSGFVGRPVTLDATVSGAGKVRWSSSSSRCRFANRFSVDTAVSCSRSGTYTFTLSLSDGVKPPVHDTVVVTFTRAPRSQRLVDFLLSRLGGTELS